MKTKKPQTAPLPPATMTARQQRAAELPRFNGLALATTSAEMDQVCSLFKTVHEDAALNVITESVKGTIPADKTKWQGILNKTLYEFSELKPESYLESMLMAQMIQVHNASGRCMERAFLENQTLQGKESNANLAIKFQRTFVAQIEALQKLRGKGGQKVTVEHVHVHEGGQAIVGNVTHAPGGRGKDGN